MKWKQKKQKQTKSQPHYKEAQHMGNNFNDLTKLKNEMKTKQNMRKKKNLWNGKELQSAL